MRYVISVIILSAVISSFIGNEKAELAALQEAALEQQYRIDISTKPVDGMLP